MKYAIVAVLAVVFIVLVSGCTGQGGKKPRDKGIQEPGTELPEPPTEPTEPEPPPEPPHGRVAEASFFTGDFESGSLGGFGTNVAGPENLEVVTDTVRAGNYALKFTLSPDDIASSKNRAEITYDNQDPEGSERWYGWSFLIPTGYTDVPESVGLFQIMGQFHDQPDFAAGETWSTFPSNPPPISIQYGLEGGEPGIALSYGLKGVNKGIIAKKTITKGKWVDIVLHVKWSQGSDGFIEAWIDGEPWVSRITGPNMYNDQSHFLKLGLYRAFGFETTNIIYYDEVRIGKSYEEVAP